MITTKELNIMTIINKLKTSISYVAYAQAKNAQWDAEVKYDGSLEKSKQTSRLLADQLVAAGAEQIDLIKETEKDKPFRVEIVNALTSAMAAKKRDLYNLKDKEELNKPATKEMIGWCSPSHIKKQLAEIDKSEKRTFIRKTDVRHFLTSRVNTAIDDLKAMVAYRLDEEKLSGKDGKAGIAPTKRAKKIAIVKKDRVDTAPKSDIEKIHALLNQIIAIWQNSTCPILKKLNVMGLSLVQKIVNLLK